MAKVTITIVDAPKKDMPNGLSVDIDFTPCLKTELKDMTPAQCLALDFLSHTSNIKEQSDG